MSLEKDQTKLILMEVDEEAWEQEDDHVENVDAQSTTLLSLQAPCQRQLECQGIKECIEEHIKTANGYCDKGDGPKLIDLTILL